jgi:AAA+ superfamily predicted ATPase
LLNPSQGLRLLFDDPCGTGKTMAIRAVANEPQLDLYPIYFRAMVSKYIGDTGR